MPTMEEFSRLVGVPILDHLPFNGAEKHPKPKEISRALSLQRSDVVTNWETRGNVQGIPIKFLFEKDYYFWDTLDLQAFEEVLALLIYGMVLFPNVDQLVDVNTIKVILSHNPVPILLGDILDSLHARTLKIRGTLLCCTPLLDRWFISHLHRSILKNEQGMKWSHRLMSLTHSDIHWCSRSSEDVTIIDRCGEFPNVPLLGIRGGITYNPCLAL